MHVHCNFISIMTSTTDNCAEIFLIANSSSYCCVLIHVTVRVGHIYILLIIRSFHYLHIYGSHQQTRWLADNIASGDAL